VLITDPAFAGSDTLATARALAATLEREGPFDLVLVGRNSVDADTGQVGPELAELLGLPFATGVRELELDGDELTLRCEQDDGWVRAEVALPAVLSTAERLCEPCKVEPPERAAVDAARIRTTDALRLGTGPWGQEGSPTWVGSVRTHPIARLGRHAPGQPLDEQIRRAVEFLVERGALDPEVNTDERLTVAPSAGTDGAAVAVVVEPDREHVTRELLGAAAGLAAATAGHVVAITSGLPDVTVLGSWGADRVVHLDANEPPAEEDTAHALAEWAEAARPWAVLAPSTAWGREVAARAAARVGAGLTGDAVALEVDDGRMVAWKPAFGGQLVAAITATSPIQMATVRAGMLSLPTPRAGPPAELTSVSVTPKSRLRVLERTRDDNLDALAEAHAVVGVGTGVTPDDYPTLRPLLDVLGAELGATRKVTDKGWLPRARQIGITGRSIAPRLYVALGLAGKFNHTVGVRGAGTVLAVNTDPEALIFACSDAGIVGDWRDVLPLLVPALADARAALGSARWL
jgi:electron transfer flavoprotein alpha subunit